MKEFKKTAAGVGDSLSFGIEQNATICRPSDNRRRRTATAKQSTI